MAPLIELRDISKIYPMDGVEVEALACVSLALERGELAAIMGASGSGKSTLLNILGTLDRPTSGTMIFDDHIVHGLDEEALARLRNKNIGFIFQAFHLLSRNTLLENVELPLIYARVPKKIRRERALEAIARVGLSDRVDHRPTQLSGGQQQRVAIARAIVNEPQVLLADEPTGALDSKTTQEILQLLRTLHEDGMTIVLVTHDVGVAHLTHRIITVADGRIVSDDRRTPDAHPPSAPCIVA